MQSVKLLKNPYYLNSTWNGLLTLCFPFFQAYKSGADPENGPSVGRGDGFSTADEERQQSGRSPLLTPLPAGRGGRAEQDAIVRAEHQNSYGYSHYLSYSLVSTPPHSCTACSLQTFLFLSYQCRVFSYLSTAYLLKASRLLRFCPGPHAMFEDNKSRTKKPPEKKQPDLFPYSVYILSRGNHHQDAFRRFVLLLKEQNCTSAQVRRPSHISFFLSLAVPAVRGGFVWKAGKSRKRSSVSSTRGPTTIPANFMTVLSRIVVGYFMFHCNFVLSREASSCCGGQGMRGREGGAVSLMGRLLGEGFTSCFSLLLCLCIRQARLRRRRRLNHKTRQHRRRLVVACSKKASRYNCPFCPFLPPSTFHFFHFYTLFSGGLFSALLLAVL